MKAKRLIGCPDCSAKDAVIEELRLLIRPATVYIPIPTATTTGDNTFDICSCDPKIGSGVWSCCSSSNWTR